MLQNQVTTKLLNGPQQEPSWESSSPNPMQAAAGFLRRQYLIILCMTVLALAGSVVFLKMVPPTYTAVVKVLMGGSKAPAVQPQTFADDRPIDLESQMEILKSKVIATSVINQLNLADDPEFSVKEGPLDSLKKKVRSLLADSANSPGDATDQLLEDFEKRLWTARIGMSNVIEVGFNASSPERAAALANAVVNAYFEDQLKAKTDEHHVTTTWLHDRLKELGDDALQAEKAVNELKRKSNIVSADGKLIDDQQVTALNNRLVAARAHTSEALTRLNRFEAILNSPNFDAASLGNLDAVPATSIGAAGAGSPEGGSVTISQNNNQILNSLRQQYLEYARREYEYSAKYGNEHMAVVNLRATMKSIRQTILDEVRRLAEIAKTDYDEAKQQQQEVEKQLAQAIAQSQNTKVAEVSVRELETSAKGYRALYDSFLQRYMGSVQQGTFPVTEARVISPATPPQQKAKPNPKMVLAIGLFGGLAFGAAFGFARELRDRSFRTTSQIESKLHLPCVSVVPLLGRREIREVSRKALASGHASNGSESRMLSKRSGAHWAASAMPLSRFAEAIRSIRFALEMDPNRAPSKVIGVTSALPEEGKSTIAAALAQMMAGSGKKVIIVDCDLRNPSLSTNLSPDAGAGIVDVLSGAKSLEETVWTDSATGLTFLPGGKKEAHSIASDILSKKETKKLFDRLRETYDYVVVDLPPLAPVVDARVMTSLVDSYVLVVQWGRTTPDVVEHALNSAPNVYDALLGVVLNKTDMTAIKRYASHYGDYYNDDHYIRYSA